MRGDENLTSISVALVEDDPVIRERFCSVLQSTAGLSLAFSASTASALIDWLGGNSVDVLLVDLGLPDRSGLEVIQDCRRLSPSTEIMVITLFGDEHHMMRAFEAGARGYLLKDGTEDDLARHVQTLRAGGSPMSPVIARQLLSRLAPVPVASGRASAVDVAFTKPQISARERDILSTLSRGYTYAEVAQLLGIAPYTVQSHVKNIYSKLDVHSKTEAIFEARQLGLL